MGLGRRALGPWALISMGPGPMGPGPMGPWALGPWAPGPWALGLVGPGPWAHGPWAWANGPIKKMMKMHPLRVAMDENASVTGRHG